MEARTALLLTRFRQKEKTLAREKVAWAPCCWARSVSFVAPVARANRHKIAIIGSATVAEISGKCNEPCGPALAGVDGIWCAFGMPPNAKP